MFRRFATARLLQCKRICLRQRDGLSARQHIGIVIHNCADCFVLPDFFRLDGQHFGFPAYFFSQWSAHILSHGLPPNTRNIRRNSLCLWKESGSDTISLWDRRSSWTSWNHLIDYGWSWGRSGCFSDVSAQNSHKILTSELFWRIQHHRKGGAIYCNNRFLRLLRRYKTGSGAWIRTRDQVVNSHLLYRWATPEHHLRWSWQCFKIGGIS